MRDHLTLRSKTFVGNYTVIDTTVYKLNIGQGDINKKTLVFCGIENLLLFASNALNIKKFDRTMKINKDGIER